MKGKQFLRYEFYRTLFEKGGASERMIEIKDIGYLWDNKVDSRLRREYGCIYMEF